MIHKATHMKRIEKDSLKTWQSFDSPEAPTPDFSKEEAKALAMTPRRPRPRITRTNTGRTMTHSMPHTICKFYHIYICICIHLIYIYMYVCIYIYMSRRQNQLLMLGTKIWVIAFCWGPIALQCFVQINTNYAKMQRNWLHGFRSLNCWEWIKWRSLSLRLQPCWELSKHIPRLFPKEGYLVLQLNKINGSQRL